MENITNNLLNDYDISKIPVKDVLFFMEFYRLARFLSFEDSMSFRVKQITNSSLLLEKKTDSKLAYDIIRHRKVLLDLFNISEYDLLSKMVNSSVSSESSILLPEEEIIINEDSSNPNYIAEKYKELKYDRTRLYYSGFHITNIDAMNDIKEEIVQYKNRNNIRLNLYSMKIGNYEIEFLCDNMKTMRNLNTLNLNGNDIEDEGLFYLTSHFKYITNLETLYLNGNYISDVGIQYFCDSCSVISKLKDLSLWSIIVVLYFIENGITDVGGELLSQYLPLCSELRQLWINDNDIVKSDVIKEKIKKNHPNKHIKIN